MCVRVCVLFVGLSFGGQFCLANVKRESAMVWKEQMDNMILHKIHFKIKQQQKKERNGKQKCFISSKSPTFVGNHSYNDSFRQFIYLIRKTIKF